MTPQTPRKKFPSSVPNSRPVKTDPKFVVSALLEHYSNPEKECQFVFKTYQKLCSNKQGKKAKTEVFEAAKKIASMVFKTVDKGKRKIEELQRESPTSDVLTSVSLLSMPQTTEYVLGLLKQRISNETFQVLEALAEKHSFSIVNCYHGRREYRLKCESKRDKGHDIAYWIFKLAFIASAVFLMNKDMLAEYIQSKSENSLVQQLDDLRLNPDDDSTSV